MTGTLKRSLGPDIRYQDIHRPRREPQNIGSFSQRLNRYQTIADGFWDCYLGLTKDRLKLNEWVQQKPRITETQYSISVGTQVYNTGLLYWIITMVKTLSPGLFFLHLTKLPLIYLFSQVHRAAPDFNTLDPKIDPKAHSPRFSSLSSKNVHHYIDIFDLVSTVSDGSAEKASLGLPSYGSCKIASRARSWTNHE